MLRVLADRRPLPARFLVLGIETREALLRHPKLGAPWEGFALSALETRLGAARGECFFYATHGGAELDLLVARGGRRIGFEFKRTVAPELTKSMRIELGGADAKWNCSANRARERFRWKRCGAPHTCPEVRQDLRHQPRAASCASAACRWASLMPVRGRFANDKNNCDDQGSDSGDHYPFHYASSNSSMQRYARRLTYTTTTASTNAATKAVAIMAGRAVS